MRSILVALIALSLGLAGCTGNVGETGDENSDGTSESPGTSDGTSSGDTYTSSASIYVKDAPTDEFSEIHLVFTKVEVHAAGGDDDDDADDNDTADDNSTADDNTTADDDGNETGSDSEGDGGWITLFESEEGVDVDLLAASGDASAFLGEADLAAGKYTQIRIHVASAYGVSLDGNDTTNITVSSGTLKIIKPFDVEEGLEAKITVDYDLDRSLKQQGPNGAWRMTPVVGSTVVEQVDDASSGEDVHHEGEINGGDEEEESDEDDDGSSSDGNQTSDGGNSTE